MRICVRIRDGARGIEVALKRISVSRNVTFIVPCGV